MKARVFYLSVALFFSLLLLYCGCKKDEVINPYITRNVIIVVVDGARLSDTWNEPTRQFIPHRAAMLEQGVFCSSFYNKGTTATNPGHAAIATGFYQNLNNGGAELPARPSIFQYWLKQSGMPQE